MKTDAHRFLLLDGMRGIAAFAVILDHVSSVTLRHWLPGRYLAVDFFFVLSGFVLAHAYGQRLSSGALSPLGFMKIRLIRLYPLYLLALAIAVAFEVVGTLRGWGSLRLSDVSMVALMALAFLPAPPGHNWTGNQLYPLNGPAWSLFFELIANFVYALVARFLTWRVFAVILPVMAAAVALTVMRHTQHQGPGWLWSHFDAGFARVLYGFFAGVMIYKLRSVIHIPALPAWAAVLALLAIFMVPAPGIWRQAWDVFAAIMLMPLLVAFASGAKVEGRIAWICGVLGMLSYGVYVLHVPLKQMTDYLLQVAGVQLPYGFVHVALIALVAAITAAIAVRFYDEPVRRRLTGRARKRVAPVPAGEAG